MAVVEQSVVRSLPNNHPNIVKFHDAGISKVENEIRYFILSEYCPSNVLKKMSGAAVSCMVCWGAYSAAKRAQSRRVRSWRILPRRRRLFSLVRTVQIFLVFPKEERAASA